MTETTLAMPSPDVPASETLHTFPTAGLHERRDQCDTVIAELERRLHLQDSVSIRARAAAAFSDRIAGNCSPHPHLRAAIARGLSLSPRQHNVK